MKTARLILRPIRLEDAPRIASLAGDWDVARMAGRIPYPYSAALAEHWVSGLAEGEIVFGIEHNGALIGICGYTPSKDRTAELGYWIGKDYWNRGFATEAVRRLIDHGYTRSGIKRFHCSHFQENAASARVITKLGFKALGPCPGWCGAPNAHKPALRYELRRPWTAAIKALAS